MSGIGRRTLPLPLLALTACGNAGGTAAAGFAVRDSAGIPIAESTAPAWEEGRGWSISADPVLEIGVVEGDPSLQLFRVVHATRMEDGRIVVANAGTREIRFYDAGGEHLRTVGGEGAGPGEYRVLRFVARVAGDSLLAWDPSLHRITRYDPAGELVGATPVQPLDVPPPSPDAASFTIAEPHIEAAFVDGSLLGWPIWLLPSPPSGVSRLPLDLLRYSPGGELVDSLTRVPGNEMLYIDHPERPSWGPLPFGIRARGTVHGDRVYWGYGDTFRIDVLSADGRLVRSIRVLRPRPPVTGEIVAGYRDRTLDRAGEQGRTRELAVLAATPFPDSLPAHGELQVDADGNLWVQEYRWAPDAPNRWQVFDPEGRWLGPVDLPQGLQVYEIGSDYVLGRWRDELDVERVRMHAIVRDGG